MNKTDIEWTDYTWNPVSGCDKVSQGCKFCYAERVSTRWGKPFLGAVKLNPTKLLEPLKKRRPGMVFVNSMSDLFHKDVPFEFIDKVFAVMVLCQRHTFQILTKRPEHMREYFSVDRSDLVQRWEDATYDLGITNPYDDPDAAAAAVFNISQRWPVSNIWLGTSCEDQATADGRIPVLIDVPASVRFVSCEPLLGPILLLHHLVRTTKRPQGGYAIGEAIHWVITGGESGPKARPADIDWFKMIRNQCNTAGVPFFFKQWGTRVKVSSVIMDYSGVPVQLDGVKHLAFPNPTVLC